MEKDPLIGKKIGNYRIISLINSGAYGSVYKAGHIHLKERIVAIKFLHASLASTEYTQFEKEAQFLSVLEHRHILPLIDFGFDGGRPYLLAKYASGGSLRDRLLRQSPLPVQQALTILSQVGQALQYAHSTHILHRDLKPENILFNAQGEALLADFGIATILSSASIKQSAIIGTPSYMAPEQFRGIVSKESDQYALGCIAYELFTGHKPFAAPDFIAMGFKHATEPPTPLRQRNAQVLPDCEAAILKAIAKQRTDRHASVEAFLTTLQEPFFQPTKAVSSLPARTKEEWFKIGNDLYKLERYEEAITAYDQAIRLDPGDALSYHGKGDVLNELERYEEAITAYDQVIRLDPNFVNAYHGKGRTLCNLGYYEEALITCDQVIRLDTNNALAYSNKGMALYKLERYEEAITAYDQAIRLDPGDALSYHGKGDVLDELERYEEAITAYDQVIRLDPNFVNAYHGKGRNSL